MPIINRDLDASQKRQFINWDQAPFTTGTTAIMGTMPSACSVDAIQITANGLSGTPVYTLSVQRFIVGTGYTNFVLGTSFSPVEFGTSGVLSVTFGFSLPVIGSTLTTLQQNDMLVIVSGGSNAAVKALNVNIVIRPLVDIQKFFGIV
jgi:hypothetical protein